MATALLNLSLVEFKRLIRRVNDVINEARSSGSIGLRPKSCRTSSAFTSSPDMSYAPLSAGPVESHGWELMSRDNEAVVQMRLEA